MRRSLAVTLTLSLLLSACVAHEKSGDRAAALGDWKTAEAAYAAAVAKDPEKKELQEKYRQARAAALDDATRKAQACAGAQDWECALAESDYALRLDGGSATMAALRRDAGREAGRSRLRRAGEASARQDHAGALALVEQARAASDDPALAGELRRVSPGVVRAAVEAAEGHRAAGEYPQALDLLGRAARVDPSLAPRVQAVSAEHERWKDGEAERLAQQGDGLLSGRRFAEARASYEAAAKLRPQSRAGALARYAGLLAAGDAAAQQRDWPAAERAFGEASRVDVDPALALAELDRVRIRPYAIRLRSVLVRPTRPDGYPWAGTRGRGFERVVARLAGAEALPPGVAIDLARRIPPENQPDLVVALSLPDGRALQTRPRHGAYAVLDGTVVVATNGYDDRVLSLRVVHDAGGGRPLDVGLVSFRIADLVARGELSLADASVVDLRVQADPADRPDGAFEGLQPIPDGTNLAPAWSTPGPASRGFRLVALDAAVSATDAGGAPDLQVEVEQRGAVVFRSPVQPGRSGASFRPAAAFLFVAPDELVSVRLLDRRGPGRVVLAQPVAGRLLERGQADLATPTGTTVRLRVEPRHVGPAR